MSIYNFKKQIKLYIVYGSSRYEIDISEITFSQTFTENSYPVKTLHNQALNFEASVINKANPANFEFSLPLIRQNDYETLFNLLLDYTSTYNINSFDLYVSTPSHVFKIENSVITSGTFEIERLKPMGLNISGQGSKLTQYVPATGVYPSWDIPGSLIARTVNPAYNIVRSLLVTLDSVDIPDSIFKCSVELQNNIDWVPYGTVNGGLSATNKDTSMYPTTYVLKDRILSGSIGRYVTSDNDNLLQEWISGVPLRIQALDSTFGLDFDMNLVTLTNRLTVGDVFTQSYDWRFIGNPTALASVVKYTTS